jgi:hypothetical protein
MVEPAGYKRYGSYSKHGGWITGLVDKVELKLWPFLNIQAALASHGWLTCQRMNSHSTPKTKAKNG